MDTAHNFDHNDASASGLAGLVAKRIAPNSDWTAMSGNDHFVQFYESDSYLVSSVAEYFFHGLRSNETCIVAATSEHVAEIERIVRDFGGDIDAARNNGQYIAFDTSDTMSKFVVDGIPDKALFDEVVGGLVADAAKRGRVRIFGEMVAVLLADGNPNAALKLEQFWNDLRTRHSFSLFCAYSLEGLSGSGRESFMTEVCNGHSRVIPGESYTSLTTADERLRAIAFLQQRARRLEAELAELDARISSKQHMAPALS